MKLLVTQFSPISYYVVSLTPKHVPQHSFLEQPHPLFLPSFTSVQINQNNRSICSDLYEMSRGRTANTDITFFAMVNMCLASYGQHAREKV